MLKSSEKDQLFLQLWREQLLESANVETIQRAIQAFFQQLSVDIISYNLRKPGAQNYSCLYAYPAFVDVGIEALEENFDDYPWCAAQMRRGEAFLCADIEQLPAEAETDLLYLRSRGLRSFAAFPVYLQGETIAHMSIGNFTHTASWSQPLCDFAMAFSTLIYEAFQAVSQEQRRHHYMNELFREIVCVSGLGYSVWERGNEIVEYKPMRQGEIKGLETIEKFIASISKPELARIRAKFKETIDKGVPHSEDLRVVTENNEVYWVRSIWSAVSFNLKHQVERAIVTYSDITDDIEHQQLLTESIEKANEANRAKSEFLARMSHEIRTPMNAILGMSHLMADEEISESQRERLNAVAQSANDLLRIINDILDFSKLDANKIQIEPINFNIDRLVDQLSLIFSGVKRNAEIEIIYSIDENVPRDLIGDPDRIKQVVVNLLSNAIKFTKRGNILLRVTLLAREDENLTIGFSVIDEGIGISADKLHTLFEPFTQADGSITRRYGGTGLGLAIAYGLVQLMGGELRVESVVNNGARFSFDLPLKLGVTAQYYNHSDLFDVGTLHALVVDDNPVALEVIASTVASLGLSVDVADSGTTAIDKNQQRIKEHGRAYDVIFMDYHMPDMDGIAATHEIKAQPNNKHLPIVIMVSAHDFSHLKAASVNVIDAYIHKPISQSRLYDALIDLFAVDTTKKESVKISDHYQDLVGKKVLLVEDNIVNQKVAVGILSKQGVLVDVVDNGLQCLKHLTEQDHYDAILMDMEMPEMDGISATRCIREYSQWQALPIIAMTAHALKGDRERFLAAGMNAYVSKPIDPEFLYQTLLETLKCD